YKGVEYADVLEALTRRRAAELFAANGISADNLFVNVQPWSTSMFRPMPMASVATR
ncbi:MAG: hypothetical protein KDE22_16805, partial [Rhodobacterales bacterium]|nr:hypothetical protein [Rhodobacterales bacterium]